ncbi:MAG: conjugal transfer protein TraG N-terminal domain-containing protein, partial [Rhodospirillales bacterium]|nr:conjugal transfer protein TraG N-terminal domain-containing protein [Rhodospirillales bacterium]
TTVDRTIVTCRDAAGRLNGQWNAEIQRAGTVFGRRIFPDARTEALARAELLAALPAAHDFLIGASRSAGEIMRQQMVLNAVHDAGEQWAAEAGNAAALRAYTEARAEAQTVSAYRAIGRQAETWVPLLRIVFECLYVGAFPMAVLLMLTPAGAAIFRSYVTGLIWLQSWGPLYAVLHRISMGEAAERMQAAALMPSGDIGISLVAQAGIRAVAADVAVMSGYLSMSVPFLAAALAYGLSKATVLATSVLAVGQDAASSAAHEGTTGNLSLANTGYDTHRFATLEGRQIRTSAHVDTDRYTGYAPAGAGFTVTGDGTAVTDAGAATSRIPAAGVRLSESLATSHQQRAAHARGISQHWSAEAGQARNAAVTDATALMERYSHDVSTGEAFARGVTETESRQAQTLDSHVEKLAEIAGISKNQAAILTGQAKMGGGLNKIVKIGADGSVMWRGQTIEQDAWNRVQEYDRQHGVTETWGRVAEASRRYSTQTGDSELASLDESLSANLARMRSFQERASLARQESESWSEQAAQVRSDAQAIERELGQPFFAWLSERAGTDGRPIGAAGAMRIASPQTAEDAEQLREHAAAFIAEKFPAPAGPDPSTVAGAAEYTAATGELREAYGRETAAAYAGWSAGVGDRAREAGAPGAGEVPAGALTERAETKTDMIVRGAGREARASVTKDEAGEGRAGVAAERNKPFEEHATENLPFIGGWLAGQLFGSARNAAPDGADRAGRASDESPDRRSGQEGWGESSP